ncbi:PBP1A family penicillin-binding protein [Rhodoplanes sp. TEM]|uniref:peptidoglycan glycosyltransferase n=1 Tax=Rhodoplanes tepidamans TaxID=200616 RepID=A0ABT5JBL1_RHOTP|nr:MULTISPECIES: PBP1A family penicillin-binding protein [Rhodoplanes]MDC7787078.1 PBP1A family penicillin-binding protein [Rhodoplanes tepidamans]MDC7986329.1 PBP1A family penicillin-binding protein [Rhodoplanes sp. TEM]MDQ0358678.1 penicillin-binding protein 1A [Rhodoplanes tepidamans]
MNQDNPDRHRHVSLWERFRRFLLDLDSRLDFGIFKGFRWTRDAFERFVVFMDRFYVGGWRRWLLVEPTSEALTLGLVGLVLMLALAIPAFQETSDEDWLKKSELAVVFLDRYGNEVGSRGIKHNDSIPLEDFPDHLIKAVLATEDRRFYEHFGIDIAGTMRALVTNARAGGVVQGGSSLSQQLAKNLFLSNERTIERKVKEAFLALWLETRLTKNEILKLYLDRAYMGGGTYGVDAAAQYYFGKSARDVTLPEAAMLAGLFKAPTKFAPHINLPAARARANVVLDNLVEAGFMTEGQVFGARRNPAKTIDRRDESAPNYYLDYAFDEMRKLVDTLPKSIVERAFVVRTALDVGLQQTADNAIQNAIKQYGRDYRARQAATVVADNEGAVRAIVGGVDYGESQFNRATDALRQPGSSFKPYVYAAALIEGMTPKSIVVDGPVCVGNWCPKNYSGGYSGSMQLTDALKRSINTIAVKLANFVGKGSPRAGRNKIVALARSMGLRTPLTDTPSLPIGAAEVTVLDHTVAYATFPNAGRAVRAHAILEVRTGMGETIWRFDRDGPQPRQVMPERVAADMAFMMNKVVEEGTARRAMLNGIKAAGKTGTTNAYRDAWFVGYTGNFVCGVWFGNDDYTPLNRMTGGSMPAMVWHTIMEYAHQGIELKNIPGLPPNPAQIGPRIAETSDVPRPAMLSSKGAQSLVRIERLMDEAARAAAVATTPKLGPQTSAPPAIPGATAAADKVLPAVRRD